MTKQSIPWRRSIPVLAATTAAWGQAGGTGDTDRTVGAVATDATDNASEMASESVERLKELDLSSITIDEMIAWLLIGAVVGSIAGTVLTRRKTGYGFIGNVLLGAVGAFIGGIIVEVLNIDAGLGRIILTYEEIIAALLCALIIGLGLRFAVGRMARGRAKQAGEASSGRG